MKYHGFLIEPVYLPGADFNVRKDGSIQDIKPKREHIDDYTLTDIDGGWKHANCASIPEAKQSIDELIKALAAFTGSSTT